MRQMNAKKVIITMVDGTVFRGSINIGNSRRISDHLRRNENMFVLFDATLGDEVEKGVYFISTRHMLWVKPDDAMEEVDSEDALTTVIESESKSN